MKIATPIYSIKISPTEMEQAKLVRKQLKTVMTSIDAICDSLKRFSEILGDIREPSDISKIRKEIIEYKKKIQEDLNAFLELVESSLAEWSKMISDNNFDAMRKAFIEEVRKVRDSGIELLERLRNPMDVSFAQSVPQDVNNIESAKDALHEVISVQLFQKIDKDILGRIRIGSKVSESING